jgi:predicted Zn-dependent protease
MATALVKMTTDLRATPADTVAGYAFIGELLTRLDKTADAQAAFEAALKVQPANGYLLAKLGQIASGSGAHDKAIEYLTRALAQEPGHPRIRFLLAAEYRQSGRLADAEQEVAALDRGQGTEVLAFNDPIRQALNELNLGSIRQVRLGAALMKAGRFASAIPVLRSRHPGQPGQRRSADAIWRRAAGTGAI